MSKITATLPEKPVRGLVVSYFGNSVAVEVDDGQVFQCHLKRNQELPVVGDYVIFQPDRQESGFIQQIEPRRTLLSRGDGRGQMKPIAANVDYIMVVMAPPPIFSDYLLDRYLVAAEILNIRGMIILNKSDLMGADESEQMRQHLAAYEKIGYPALLTSIFQEQSIHALGKSLAGKSAVLVGPSGVGKSSIISRLVNYSPDEIRIGAVSDKGAGKHTTTASRLYHLPEGGSLIDSPGVREFNLWKIDQDVLWRGFPEFAQYETGCRFRDCRHRAEPGCTVQDAIASGKISQNRYNNYLKLFDENVTKNKY